MKNLAIIVIVAWMLFGNGYSYIKSFMGSNNLQTVPQTILKGASTVASGAAAPDSTGRVAVRPPASTGARVVVPQGMPVLPTATPEVLAMAPPVSNAEATHNAEIHALIVTPPTPVQYGTEECNSSNATFKGKKEVQKNGIPIGTVESISCVSQKEVDEGLRIREYAMLANHQ